MYGWDNTLDKLSPLGHFRIRLLQFGLHYAVPYFLVSKMWARIAGKFPWRLAIGIEVLFNRWMAHIVLPRLRETPVVLEPSWQPIKEAWTSAMDAVQASAKVGYPFEKFFSGWWHGADVASIPRDNLVEWVGCACFGKEAHEPSCQKDAVEMVDQTCARFGLNPPVGHDSNVRFHDPASGPLYILQRSLLMYVISSALPRLAVAALFRVVLGLRRSSCEETGVHYWWRAPLAKDPNCVEGPPDLLFFHGLCGFTGYVPLVLLILLQSPSRGAVLFETEDVSQCLNFARPHTRVAVVKTARSALERLHSERGGPKRSCVIFGHSLGSAAAAQLLEDPPTAIAGTVLADPVCLLLQLPDVAHSFLQRSPETIFDWFCFLFCATEPGIQRCVRNLVWYNSCLNPQSAKHVPTLLCLSGKDRVVPSQVVRDYAETALPHADVLWWAHLHHTCFMLSVRCNMEVAQWILNCSPVPVESTNGIDNDIDTDTSYDLCDNEECRSVDNVQVLAD